MDVNRTVYPRKIQKKFEVIKAWDGYYSLNPNHTPIYYFGQILDDQKPSVENSKEKLKQKDKKHVPLLNKICGAVKEYLDTCSLHGLKYLGDTTLSYFERFFWLTAFLSALCFAIFFITMLFTKYSDSPVIISYDPKLVRSDTIPFPSITFCNMNIVLKSKANKIIESGSEIDKIVLSDMCDTNDTPNMEYDYKKVNWRYMQNFFLNTSQSCEDMLEICRWESIDIDCNFNINVVFTDDGYCCSFNKLPINYTLKYPLQEGLNLTYPRERVDWNPEDGYPDNTSPNALPWRSMGAGANLGLTVALDVSKDEYYCSSTNAIGFKVLLSNAIESPKMADFGFYICPGFETRVEIEPIITSATDSLKDIDLEKRLCFFTDERKLTFYRLYTQVNCRLECQANYTLQMCGCVPYYLPRNYNTTVCGKDRELCTSKAKHVIEKYNHQSTACACHPSCNDIGYTYRSSASYFSPVDTNVIKALLDKNMTRKYIIENIAIVHFFYKKDKFTKQMKSNLYGFSEFLSNTGGLLGLFLGFSFMSAIELIYFLCLKIVCKSYRQQKKNQAIPFSN